MMREKHDCERRKTQIVKRRDNKTEQELDFLNAPSCLYTFTKFFLIIYKLIRIHL